MSRLSCPVIFTLPVRVVVVMAACGLWVCRCRLSRLVGVHRGVRPYSVVCAYALCAVPSSVLSKVAPVRKRNPAHGSDHRREF